MIRFPHNNSVTIEISLDSIYMHTVAHVVVKGKNSFSVKSNLEVISINRGTVENDKIVAERCDFYEVDFDVLGMVHERSVSQSLKGNLGNHYGTNFYPFISSVIEGNIKLDAEVSMVKMVLPDKYRLLFMASFIKQNGNKSLLRQSFGIDDSSFLFTWNSTSDSNINSYVLDFSVPVRLSGASLFGLVKFPLLYWVIELASIALISIVASETVDSSTWGVTLGAVVTCWVFMLQSWHGSKPPRYNCILTYIYLLFAFLLGLWGISWEIFHYWTLLLLVPYSCLLYYVWKAAGVFGKLGILPSFMGEVFARLFVKGDKHRLKETNSAILIGKRKNR